MIPMALITGFLGSGKTTLLKHLIKTQSHRRLLYLVNEFSDVDVDGPLLDLPHGRSLSITGGSIFCQCLVADFIRVLNQIARKAAHLDGVVIEASGVANPQVVRKMLAETELDQEFAIAQIVAVVDPGTFEDLIETLPNLRAQLESATQIVINKTDQYDMAELDALEGKLREINPTAALQRTTFGQIDFDPTAQATEGALGGELAACADPNFERLVVEPATDLDIDQLRTLLTPLPTTVYRLKGFVRSAGQTWYVDVSRTGVVIEPYEGDETPARLAVIFAPAHRAAVKKVVDQLAGGTLVG
jgi:G3E family GTPase